MEQSFDFTTIMNDAFNKFGKANIIITGKTGVGKSTLINAIFSEKMAETGVGKPITQNIKEYTKENYPLSIIDTKGLELNNYESISNELKSLINQRKTNNPKDHINLAWYCINYNAGRIEDKEIEFIRNLGQSGLKVIVVFTQTITDNNMFFNEVKNILYKDEIYFVKTLALSYKTMAGEIPSYGLKELVDLSLELLPEAQKQAFAAAQKIDISQRVKQCHKIVATAAVAAAGIGATPIPFSDAVALAPVQVGMLASISLAMGLQLTKAFLTTLVSSAAGIVGASMAGRAIVSGLLKLIPGAGSVLGGTIAAGTAATLTTTMGEAYIKVLESIVSSGKEVDAEEIAKAFKKQLSMH